MNNYNSAERCWEYPDDSGFELRQIEVRFAIPVAVTHEQSRRLHDVLDDIVNSPWNQPKEGVHWIFGNGSKPLFSQSDQRFLGLQVDAIAPESGEPTFDDTVYFIETSARAFGSEDERSRVLARRTGVEETAIQLNPEQVANDYRRDHEDNWRGD